MKTGVASLMSNKADIKIKTRYKRCMFYNNKRIRMPGSYYKLKSACI
jgi:hypothetical protein